MTQREEGGWALCMFTILLAYCLLAVLFLEERLFADASNDVFRIVSQKTFLDFGRVGDAAVQFFYAPAVALAALGASVRTVASAFTLGIPLTAVLVFLFLYIVNRDLLSCLALALILMVDEGSNFYFPSFLRAASCLIVLASSTVDRWGSGPLLDSPGSPSRVFACLRALAGLLILTCCLYVASYHHTSLICALFALGCFLFGQPKQRFLAGAGILALVAVLVVKFLFPSAYESQVTSKVSLHHWNMAYLGKLGDFLIHHYAVSLVLLSSAVGLLLWRRRFLFAGFVLASAIAFQFILNCVFGVDRNSFVYYHYAVELFPMFGVLALCHVLRHSSVRVQRLALLMGLILCLHGLAGIVQESHFFSCRTAYLKRLISSDAACRGGAFVVTKNNIPVDLGIPFHMDKETLLLSAMAGHVPAKLIAFNEKRVPPKRYVEAPPWLNKQPLKPINTALHPRDIDAFLKSKDVSLAVHLDGLVLESGASYSPLVTIRYTGDDVLHSRDGSGYRLRISYHWFNGTGCVVWDGVSTPLETDVFGAHTQPFTLEAPPEPGTYRLVMDLVVARRGWLRVGEERTVDLR